MNFLLGPLVGLNFFTHGVGSFDNLIILFDFIFLPFLLLKLISGEVRVKFVFIIFLLFFIIQNVLVYFFLSYEPSFKLFVDNLTIIYGFLIFCVFYSSILKTRNIDATVQSIIFWWWLGGCFAGVGVVSVLLGIAPETWRLGVRINGTFKAINQMQAFLAPCLLISLYLFLQSGRYIYLGSYLIFILSLLTTGSRSSLVFIGFSYLYITHYWLLVKNRRSSLLFFVFTFGFLILASVLGAVVFGDFTVLGVDLNMMTRLADKTLSALDGDLGPRGEQYLIVFDNFGYYPLGIGFGGFQEYFAYKNEVHNSFLGVLIEQGWLQFLIVIWLLLIFPAWLFVKHMRSSKHLVVLILYLFAAMVIYQLSVYGLRQRIFWISLALFYGFFHVERQARRDNRRIGASVIRNLERAVYA